MKKIILSIASIVMVGMLVGCGTSEDAISVITREDGSGTRGAFVEITGIVQDGIDNTTVEAIVHDGTGKVLTAVQNDKNTIGYISLGSLNETVKGVSINGVAPTIENVTDGSYLLARPFNIAMGEDVSATTQDFIDFIISSNGQTIVNENGFVGIYDNADYTSANAEGTITIGGSTSVFPLMEKLAEAYKEINPNVTINIEAIGSSAGVKGAVDGTFDIGMASRELKDSEKAEIKHMAIARDGIVVIVNNENVLTDLSIEQVASIYTGESTAFNQLNG